MTRRLSLYLIILLVAVWVGLAIQRDTGYVVIAYGRWIISSSFWAAVLTLLLSIFSLYQIGNLIGLIRHVPMSYQRHREKSRVIEAHRSLIQGLFKLAGGACQEAEIALLQGVHTSDIPTMHYFMAAYAAYQCHDRERLQSYLKKLTLLEPKQKDVLDLVLARFYLEHREDSEAFSILERLQKKDSCFKGQVLSLLKEIYIHQQQKDRLLELLPKLSARDLLTHEAFCNLGIEAVLYLLGHTVDGEELQKIWHQVPHSFQKQPMVLYSYVQQLIRWDRDEEAMTLISQRLNSRWSEDWVILLGVVKSKYPDKQLLFAEQWISVHPSAELFLALGRIASRLEQWDKVEEYLKSSLELRKTAEGAILLAQLYERKFEVEKALTMYRIALEAS